MVKFDDSLTSTYAVSRAAWRKWLTANHNNSPGVWLIYYKVKSDKPSVRYAEAVKEALCFGWIDSKIKSIDSERYQQIFTPRKPQSVWSKQNKQYVEELIQAGLMTPAGWEKIELAKQNGFWYQLDKIEALIIPADLQQALAANPKADQFFQTYSNSTKKNILFWIANAKQPHTRAIRIEKTVNAAAQNNNPFQRI